MMRFSKANVAPRHCRLSRFYLRCQHRCRSSAGLRTAIAPGASSSYRTSAAFATNPVPRRGARTAVHKRLTNAAQAAFRALPGQIESGDRARLSDQAPANIGENKEANDDQGAGDDGAQRGPRHGMSEVAPNQEPPLRVAARISPKAKSSLP